MMQTTIEGADVKQAWRLTVDNYADLVRASEGKPKCFWIYGDSRSATCGIQDLEVAQ